MIFLVKGVTLLWLAQRTYANQTDVEKKAPTPGDLHTSPEHLVNVFAFDRVVGDALRNLATSNQHTRMYLESYGWLVTDARQYDGDMAHPFFVGHPLHVFALIKRLVLFYPHIRIIFTSFEGVQNFADESECMNKDARCDLWSNQGSCEQEKEYMMLNCPEACGICTLYKSMKAILEAENHTVLPSPWDLTGAAEAIGNLQIVYDLPITDLTNGKIYNSFSSVELNEWDCVRIARASARQERYSSAWVWYEHIRRKTTNPEMAAYATDLLNNIAFLHDINWKDTDNFFEKPLSEDPYQKARNSIFFRLCQGDDLRGVTSLKCELTTMGNPFFLLQPVKQETILQDPDMYVFHDVISETEIETLKQLSTGNLIRDHGNKRIARMTFLKREKHPVLESLTRRSSMLTGLRTDDVTLNVGKETEPLKIRNYGTGGHLIPHADAYYKHLSDPRKFENYTDGDRIATVMYYLNDVTAGGRTAFYNANVTLTPEKGSAAFWFNLKKNGDYDKRVNHGGCPVVLGTKWVALKWIRENFNFQTRPCSTTQEE